jgi:hypothetical protein
MPFNSTYTILYIREHCIGRKDAITKSGGTAKNRSQDNNNIIFQNIEIQPALNNTFCFDNKYALRW